MTNLLTVADLEDSLGRELTTEEAQQAEYYIALISRYITSYTKRVFELGTSTVRFKADYWGRIELPEGPVTSIEDVRYHHGAEAWGWQWDGLEEIYGLKPNAVVDVTYVHGFDGVPDDISKVATEATKRIFLSPEGQDVGPLSNFRVGDIEEAYNIPEGVLAGGLFNDLDKLILDDYRLTETTYRLGCSQPDNLSWPESNANALFE